MASVRARIKTENPEAALGELTKLAAAEWKALSKEDKQPFEEQSKARS